MFVGIETAARCKLIAQPEIAVKLSACGYQIDLLDEFDTLLPNEQIFKSLKLLPFHLFPFPLFPFFPSYPSLCRGSSFSRRPSPMKLNESTERAIISPGKMNKCGAVNQNSRESSIILPHEGIGSGTPNPKKLIPASASIAPAIPSDACTING